MTTSDSVSYKIFPTIKYLQGLLTAVNTYNFDEYLETILSNLFIDERDKMDIYELIDAFERDDDETILTVKPNTVFHLYCIVIRFIKDHYSIIEPRFHRCLEKFERDVADGKITEQQYIEYCNSSKIKKKFMDDITLVYRDSRNIYFIECPDEKQSLVIAINGLPPGDNLVKYMFNYDLERDRCIALKVKQAEAERKAKQSKDDEELIQAFQEQKTKEKKQNIQDLTRQANKKKAKEERLRKEFEESAAKKELEKLKDKKKKQRKLSKA